MKAKEQTISSGKKSMIRILAVTAAILSIPLIAMQFTEEVDWKLFDFILIGTLLMTTGYIYEFVVKKVKDIHHRYLLIIALFGGLFLLWVHLAVGIVDTWPLAGS